jgi:hypothetical protein
VTAPYLSTVEEVALRARAREGDEHAYEVLIERHRNKADYRYVEIVEFSRFVLPEELLE